VPFYGWGLGGILFFCYSDLFLHLNYGGFFSIWLFLLGFNHPWVVFGWGVFFVGLGVVGVGVVRGGGGWGGGGGRPPPPTPYLDVTPFPPYTVKQWR
jgi:hypothetical protein